MSTFPVSPEVLDSREYGTAKYSVGVSDVELRSRTKRLRDEAAARAKRGDSNPFAYLEDEERDRLFTEAEQAELIDQAKQRAERYARSNAARERRKLVDEVEAKLKRRDQKARDDAYRAEAEAFVTKLEKAREAGKDEPELRAGKA